MSTCGHLRCEQTFLGVDPLRGRFADVYLKTCAACGARFIHYYFEYEHLTGRGRWYEGEITAEQAARVTAETAAAMLEALPSYQAGGSYFGGKIHARSGPLIDSP
jgi:hypothetical protein